jgi:hypothetical protein
VSARFIPSRACELTVEGSSRQSIAIGFTYEGLRYHTWLNQAQQLVEDGALYKNPPRGVERNSPHWFETRTQYLSSAFGRAVRQWLTPQLPALIAQAQAAIDAADADAQLRQQQIAAAERLRNAAPALLDALRLMLTDYRSEGCPDPKCGVCARSRAAEAAAHGALAKAVA